MARRRATPTTSDDAERNASARFKAELVYKVLVIVGLGFAGKLSWNAWDQTQESIKLASAGATAAAEAAAAAHINQSDIVRMLQGFGMRVEALERHSFGEVRRPEHIELPMPPR